MNQQIDRGHKTRDGQARTPCRSDNQEGIMVKWEARANVPASETNLILGERGLLAVPSPIGEREHRLLAGIELSRVTGGILQSFVNRAKKGVCPNLPVMSAMMTGHIRADIAFAESAPLGGDDRCRERTGGQLRAG